MSGHCEEAVYAQSEITAGENAHQGVHSLPYPRDTEETEGEISFKLEPNHPQQNFHQKSAQY